jgi:transcriptional regulator GlxA family with amidase domain
MLAGSAVLAAVVSLASVISTLAQEQSPPPPRNVAVLVHEGVELLDFAGPAEVFASASLNGRRAFNVYTVAPVKQPVRSNQSVTVVPDYSIEDCPRPDILVIPGGNTGVVLRDERVMTWIKEVSNQSEITLTVCTGAFTLAQQGILDGRKATTHYSAIERLRRISSKIQVLENVRFVDNGRIITTAGISAGIDGSLHVVARLCGEDSARATARYMEYDWSPQSNAPGAEQEPAASQQQ